MVNPSANESKSFTEAMYRKVGLTTNTGSRGQARQKSANLNEDRSYQVTDDPTDVRVQRQLAGVTQNESLNFPNPSGATRLRPPNGEGVLDLNSTLEAIGLPRNTPRLFESRTSADMAQEAKAARLEILRARREELELEMTLLDQEISGYKESAPVSRAPIQEGSGRSFLIRKRVGG